VFLRKTLSLPENKLMEIAVGAGLIQKLDNIILLREGKILLEICWILTNLAAISADFVTVLRALGTDMKILTIALKSSIEICEQVFFS